MDFFLGTLFSGDNGILQTVSKIRDAVHFSLRSPEQRIRKRAEAILRNFQVPERDEKSEVSQLANFVRSHFHFVYDPKGLEYVKSPEVIDEEISRYGQFMGDCDDAAGYLASLLKSVGYRANFVIISNPKNPRKNFTHIYTEAYLPKFRRWVSLDMTAKKKPLGWSAPAERLRKYEV